MLVSLSFLVEQVTVCHKASMPWPGFSLTQRPLLSPLTVSLSHRPTTLSCFKIINKKWC